MGLRNLSCSLRKNSMHLCIDYIYRGHKCISLSSSCTKWCLCYFFSSLIFKVWSSSSKLGSAMSAGILPLLLHERGQSVTWRASRSKQSPANPLSSKPQSLRNAGDGKLLCSWEVEGASGNMQKPIQICKYRLANSYGVADQSLCWRAIN